MGWMVCLGEKIDTYGNGKKALILLDYCPHTNKMLHMSLVPASTGFLCSQQELKSVKVVTARMEHYLLRPTNHMSIVQFPFIPALRVG